MPHVLHSSGLLISASKALSEQTVGPRHASYLFIADIPLVVTEQYPKALGHTSKRICGSNTNMCLIVSSLDISGAKVFEKTKFSMLTDEVATYLADLKNTENRRSAVLFGLETHVCVQVGVEIVVLIKHSLFIFSKLPWILSSLDSMLIL